MIPVLITILEYLRQDNFIFNGEIDERKLCKLNPGKVYLWKLCVRADSKQSGVPNSAHWLRNYYVLNTLRPRRYRRHFADDPFKCISLIENVSIPIQFSLKFVPKGPSNNIPALVQIMAWRRPGDKPLSDPMMVRLPTHICVTRPQWVITLNSVQSIENNRLNGDLVGDSNNDWWTSLTKNQ